MRRTIIIIAMLTSGLAMAGESAPMPQLGDHVFVPVMTISEPFISTFVQTTIGMGKTVDATVPVFDLEGDDIIAIAKADLFVAGIGFRYQHAAKDWLAVRIALNTIGRLGTSTSSLLAEGVTGTVGYNLGWLMRVHHSKKFILSSSVGLGNQNATFVNLLDWVQGVLNGESAPLVRSQQSVRGSAGIHAAWGISRRFGLLGTALGYYGESFDGKGKNNWDFDGRLAVSYDLQYDLKVPLGLALAGGHYENDDFGGERSGVWFWSARLAIQTRQDFTIGIDLVSSQFNFKTDDPTLTVREIAIDMRYYY